MTKKAYIVISLVIPAFFWVVIATILINPVTVAASNGADAQITTSINAEKINRHRILTEFFKKYKSPLIEHVDTFVAVADKYNMDYRLLPAISCTESTCGKFLIPGSYNPFGWGIYGKNAIHFKDYDEAIETVAAGIHKGYISKGLHTVEQIERIYTPPSKGSWRKATKFFMNQMDTIAYGDFK
jgi:hypothetical protein